MLTPFPIKMGQVLSEEHHTPPVYVTIYGHLTQLFMQIKIAITEALPMMNFRLLLFIIDFSPMSRKGFDTNIGK